MNYDTVQFKPYQSMFVPTGRTERAAIEKDRYDAASAEKTALDRALGMMRVGKGDEKYKNMLKAEVDGLINGRVDYENMGHIVTDATTRILTNEPMMKALDSFKMREAEREHEAKLRMQGKLVDFGRAYKTDKDGKLLRDADGNPIRKHVFDDGEWDTGSQGVYVPHAEESLDWAGKAEQMMHGIAENPVYLAKVSSITGISPDEVKEIMLSYGTQVPDKRVRQVAEAITEEFSKTDEGRQLFRKLTKLDLTEKGELHTSEEAMSKLTEYLEGIGNKQIGKKMSYTGISKADPGEPPYSPHLDVVAVNRPENDAVLLDAFTKGITVSKDAAYDHDVAPEVRFKEMLSKKPDLGSWSADDIQNHAKGIHQYINDKFKAQRLPGETTLDLTKRVIKALGASTSEVGQGGFTGDSRTQLVQLIKSKMGGGAESFYSGSGDTDAALSFGTLMDKMAGLSGSESAIKERLMAQLDDGSAELSFIQEGKHAGKYKVNFDNGKTIGGGTSSIYVKIASQQDNGFELVRAAYRALESKGLQGEEVMTKEEVRALSESGILPGLDPNKSIVVRAVLSGDKFVPVVGTGEGSNWKQLYPRPGNEDDTSWLGRMIQRGLELKKEQDPGIFGPLNYQKVERQNR